MAIDVTVRHIDDGAADKKYATYKAGELADEFPRVEHIHVILDVEKHRNIAEVVVQAKNHVRVEALESSDTMGAAIDAAIEKAHTQLRKLRDKIQEHRVRPRNRVQNVEEESGEEHTS